MSAGQILNVVVCSSTSPGAAGGQVAGPMAFAGCPAGEDAYVIRSYVPYAASQSFIDGLMAPFDQAVAGGIFGFAFGTVVFFYLLGVKFSVIVRPFWRGA